MRKILATFIAGFSCIVGGIGIGEPAYAFLGQAWFAGSAAGTGYFYYRIVIDSVHSKDRVAIGNIDFRINSVWVSDAFSSASGTIGGYPVAVSESSYYDSTYAGWYGIEDSLEGNSTNYWLTPSGTFSGSNFDGNQWIQLQFSRKVQINGLNIFKCATICQAGYMPDRWHLEGSDNGVNFTTIPGSSVSIGFDITSQTNYSYTW